MFELEQPDALLLYGDTNTCPLSFRQTAQDSGVSHGRANRRFDQRAGRTQPQGADHLSDINMVK